MTISFHFRKDMRVYESYYFLPFYISSISQRTKRKDIRRILVGDKFYTDKKKIRIERIRGRRRRRKKN